MVECTTSGETVFYSGLPEHPSHELAKRQQSDFGAVLSFEVQGGQAGAWSVINATELVSLTGEPWGYSNDHYASQHHDPWTPNGRPTSGGRYPTRVNSPVDWS